MRKIIFDIMIFMAALPLFCSCEAYLDKAPDMGIDRDDILQSFETMRGYLDKAYTYLDQFMGVSTVANERSHVGCISDEFASLLNTGPFVNIHHGNWSGKEVKQMEIGNNSLYGGTTIYHSYQGIRIANWVMENIDYVNNITEDQKKQLMGQAHFFRAWFYFQLINRYGGMPILDKTFVGNGDEDLPRKENYHESLEWMMQDLEAAIELLPLKWDNENIGRADKIAAMAVKAQARLYDASPLMQNDINSTEIKPYDKERARIAAKAINDVFEIIDEHPELGLQLAPTNQYHSIFYKVAPPFSHSEYLWYNRNLYGNATTLIICFWLPCEYANGTGWNAAAYNAPTQNMVNMFEKKGPDGNFYPITDPKSGYSLQNQFTDRDPRLKNNILIPGQKWGNDKQDKPQYVTTYIGGAIYNTTNTNSLSNKRQQTGYLCKKFLWETANQWKTGYSLYKVFTVYIRLSQMYLDFAEASFEATGDATAKIAGCKYSAEEALNIIRERAGITPLTSDYVSDPEKFREAYRRERCVELMFEAHRWEDLRRWMIAHEVFKDEYPIIGLKAWPKDPDHDKVQDKSTLLFDYEEYRLEVEVRNFQMRNYWYPFADKDVAGLKNLKQNPGW